MRCEGVVKVLGIHHFRLFSLLMEDRVRQGLAFIPDGDIFLCIEADRHHGLAQGESGTWRLDLVHDLFELDRQVLGQRARFLPGEDPSEVIFGSEGTMGIHGTSWFDGKALVEIVDEFWQ